MYNWSVLSPQGEVYASTNATISWKDIQCFNYTATGAYTGEANNGGTTNLYGLNLSALEARFNFVDANTFNNSVDGVNETFLNSNSHGLFYTASNQFSVGECKSAFIYDNSGKSVSGNFEEILLYEPTTSSLIFTTILENNLAGFDSRTHDFEMLVLDDAHGTNTAPTTYYFFVELE
jgi:hypothetical protein